MKLTALLIMTCCSAIVARAETVEVDQEALLRRASEQLERLAPYRRVESQETPVQRTPEQGTPDLSSLLAAWKSTVNRNDLDGTKNEVEQSAPWEIVEILPERTQLDAGTGKQADDDDDDDENEKHIMIGIVADPRYTQMMQERIKRGFDAGSASLLTGIAGGVLHGLASASSSSAGKASASSSYPVYDAPPAYGPPHAADHVYVEKHFGPWDFKKAIFGTVFQALKAISGGVLALKGQLIKGSGYLLAAKGKVISKTGDVITSFGKQITSGVSSYPKPYASEIHVHDDHPPSQHIEHHVSYHGPPSLNEYTETNGYPHSVYGVPSDDDNQGGLLIVKPTKSDLDEHSDQHANVVEEKPDLTKLEESFGGPTKGSVIKDFFSSVPKGSGGSADHQAVSQENYSTNQNPNSPPSLEHPPPTYGAPEHYSSSHDNPPMQNYDTYPANQNNENYPVSQNYESYPANQNNENYPVNQNYENYPANQNNENYPVNQNNENYSVNQNNENYPQISQNNIPYQPELPLTHNFPHPIDDHHHHHPFHHYPSIQPSLEYPPLHVQQFDHAVHAHNALTSPLLKTPKLPDDDGPSVYASLTVDTEPQLAPLKIPLLGYPGAFDLPKLHPHVDFHGQHFASGLHNSLDDPLRIHLLKPSGGLPAHFWHGQGWVAPVSAYGTLNSFRKRNVLRRMLANRVARH